MGLITENNLIWQPQLTSMSRKVTGTLPVLDRHKNFLAAEIKTVLVQTLILTIVDYDHVCLLWPECRFSQQIQPTSEEAIDSFLIFVNTTISSSASSPARLNDSLHYFQLSYLAYIPDFLLLVPEIESWQNPPFHK